MRELKFRAWDKTRNGWLEMNLQMSVFDGVLWWQYGYGCEVLSMEDTKNIVLQQYTGIDDKCDERIYEGDIVKRDYGINPDGTYWLAPHIFKVVFEKTCFGYYWIWENHPDGNGFWPLYDQETRRTFHSHNLEIIGNIYETPEYLNESGEGEKMDG